MASYVERTVFRGDRAHRQGIIQDLDRGGSVPHTCDYLLAKAADHNQHADSNVCYIKKLVSLKSTGALGFGDRPHQFRLFINKATSQSTCTQQCLLHKKLVSLPSTGALGFEYRPHR